MSTPFKKIFWIVFWVIFVIVFIVVAMFVGRVIYKKITGEQVDDLFSIKNIFNNEKLTSELTEDDYTCTSDKSVQSRGYFYIHGSGGQDNNTLNALQDITSTDNKKKEFVSFVYDANNNLEELSDRFISEFNQFSSQNFDEIIILAESAGGVIASFSAHRIDTNNSVEIHTFASPLNGYKFGSASEAMAKNFYGFNKEIAIGFDAYIEPSNNIKVYHHKTLEDKTLRDFCGSYASFCSPKVIQNNNVPNSQSFVYPNDTHSSIVFTATNKIVNCRL